MTHEARLWGLGKRERIWFSPACVQDQPDLFAAIQRAQGRV